MPLNKSLIDMRSGVHYLSRMSVQKNSAAVALGKKGGEATAKNLTPAQRTKAARNAANARWSKPKKKSS
jgi:hypothetical protein